MEKSIEELLATAVFEAVNSIRHGIPCTINAIAEKYGVPPHTLYYRVRNADEDGFYENGNAKQQKLTVIEEAVIEKYVLDRIEAGKPVTKSDLKSLGCEFMDRKGENGSVKNGWYRLFMRRHPVLKSKLADERSLSRIKAGDYKSIKTWFDKFQREVFDKGIKPQNIYNMDETNIKLGDTGTQWIIQKQEGDPMMLPRLDSAEFVSILETVSMSGVALNPCVIFKGKYNQTSWFEETKIPDWGYGCSDNGWTTNNHAVSWLIKWFIPRTGAGKDKDPIVLLLDNHGSHKSDQFIQICLEHNVHPLFMPAHSLHLLQPLDMYCFALVKKQYKRATFEKLKNWSYDARINFDKRHFLKAYADARELKFTKKSITDSWKKAGLSRRDYANVLDGAGIINRPKIVPNTKKNEASEVPNVDICEPYSYPKKSNDLNNLLHKLDGTDCDLKLLLKNVIRSLEKRMAESVLRDIEIAQVRAEMKAPVSSGGKRMRTRINPQEGCCFAIDKDVEEAFKTEDYKRRKMEATARKRKEKG